MKPAASLRGAIRRVQGGVAAVELAVILLAIIVLVPAVALFAKVFFQYSVIKGSSYDVATYLASLQPAAITDESERARAFAVAEQMVREAADGAGMTGSTKVNPVAITCNRFDCTPVLPQVIGARITMTIDDAMFNQLTGTWTHQGKKIWVVNAESTVPFTK